MQPLIQNATFRQEFSLEFSLYTIENGDQSPVIYLQDETQGQDLSFTISNTDTTNIALDKPTDLTPSLENYHLQLRFRPGTLSSSFLALGDKLSFEAQNSTNWKACVGIDKGTGISFISFLNISGTFSLAPKENLQILIKNVSASNIGGTRATTTEFLSDQINSGTIKNTRRQNLNLINHQGQKSIPLHADTVGSSTILNDGQSQNTLALRLVNLSKKNVITFSSCPQSTLTLRIPFQPSSGEQEEWALGEEDNISKVQLDCSQLGKLKEGSPVINGNFYEWDILCNEASLQAAEGKEIILKNIVSGISSGNSIIQLAYQNIPGYWDGNFPISIVKSPIKTFLTQKEGQSETSGIYSTNPLSLTHPNGELNISKYTPNSVVHTKEDPTLSYFFQGNNLSSDKKSLTNQVSLGINAAFTANSSVSVETDPQMGQALILGDAGAGWESLGMNCKSGINFTTCGWFNFDEIPPTPNLPAYEASHYLIYARALGTQKNALQGYLSILVDNNYGLIFLYDFGGETSTVKTLHAPSANQWVHLAASVSITTNTPKVTFYINGEEAALDSTYNQKQQHPIDYKEAAIQYFSTLHSFGASTIPNICKWGNSRFGTLRIYETDLDQNDIKSAMEMDSSISKVDILTLDENNSFNFNKVGPKSSFNINSKVGINSPSPDTELQVNGVAKIDNKSFAPPTKSINGGSGTRVVFWEGTPTQLPTAHGIDKSTLWSSVPSSASHKWYVGIDTSSPLMEFAATGYKVNTNAIIGLNQISSPKVDSTTPLSLLVSNKDKGGAGTHWNITDGQGETDFINYKTYKYDGNSFNFYNMKSSKTEEPYQNVSKNETPIVSFNDTGVITTPGVSFPSGALMTSPIQNIIQLTESGSWPVPVGITNIKVTLVGGGGAGGNAPGGSAGGGGGGGGETVIGYMKVSPQQEIGYSVGEGGSHSFPSLTAEYKDPNGGKTTFESLVAQGGCVGSQSDNRDVAGGDGGSSSSQPNAISIPGQSGQGGIAGDGNIGGAGGSSQFGTGGYTNTTNRSGYDASGFGAGGSGGKAYGAHGDSYDGGSGSPGTIIIEY